MLLIRTTTGKSLIHGYGLYAAEYIEKGRPIWFKSDKDIEIPMSQIPYEYREYLDRYATVEKKGLEQIYNLDCDDAKFINHSEDPNIVFIGNIGIAISDIEINEEIICDYRTITTPEHFELLML
jgi:SET domain-containing protein